MQETTNSKKLADLIAKKAQVDAQIDAIKARQKKEKRAQETRVKILIGAYFLAELKKYESSTREGWVTHILSTMSERDKATLCITYPEVFMQNGILKVEQL